MIPSSVAPKRKKLEYAFQTAKRRKFEAKGKYVCRTCLATYAKNNLFSSTYVGYKLIYILETYLNIKVKQYDGISTNICDICMKRIQDFYKFILQVESAELTIQRWLPPVKNKIEKKTLNESLLQTDKSDRIIPISDTSSDNDTPEVCFITNKEIQANKSTLDNCTKSDAAVVTEAVSGIALIPEGLTECTTEACNTNLSSDLVIDVNKQTQTNNDNNTMPDAAKVVTGEVSYVAEKKNPNSDKEKNIQSTENDIANMYLNEILTRCDFVQSNEGINGIAYLALLKSNKHQLTQVFGMTKQQLAKKIDGNPTVLYSYGNICKISIYRPNNDDVYITVEQKIKRGRSLKDNCVKILRPLFKYDIPSLVQLSKPINIYYKFEAGQSEVSEHVLLDIDRSVAISLLEKTVFPSTVYERSYSKFHICMYKIVSAKECHLFKFTYKDYRDVLIPQLKEFHCKIIQDMITTAKNIHHSREEGTSSVKSETVVKVRGEDNTALIGDDNQNLVCGFDDDIATDTTGVITKVECEETVITAVTTEDQQNEFINSYDRQETNQDTNGCNSDAGTSKAKKRKPLQNDNSDFEREMRLIEYGNVDIAEAYLQQILKKYQFFEPEKGVIVITYLALERTGKSRAIEFRPLSGMTKQMLAKEIDQNPIVLFSYGDIYKMTIYGLKLGRVYITVEQKIKPRQKMNQDYIQFLTSIFKYDLPFMIRHSKPIEIYYRLETEKWVVAESDLQEIRAYSGLCLLVENDNPSPVCERDSAKFHINMFKLENHSDKKPFYLFQLIYKHYSDILIPHLKEFHCTIIQNIFDTEIVVNTYYFVEDYEASGFIKDFGQEKLIPVARSLLKTDFFYNKPICDINDFGKYVRITVYHISEQEGHKALIHFKEDPKLFNTIVPVHTRHWIDTTRLFFKFILTLNK